MHKTLLIGFLVAFVALHAFLKQRGPAVAKGTQAAPLLGSVNDPIAADVIRVAQQHRVTVVTFFETWCGPCRQELPQLEKLYKEREATGLGMVGIYSGSSSEVEAFTQQFGLSFPLLFDSHGALARAYEVDAVPTSVVLDANLQVLAAARGFKPSFVMDVLALLDQGTTP